MSTKDEKIKSLLKQIKRLGRELAVAQDRQVYYENTADQNQNLLNTRIEELEAAREALKKRGRELEQSEKRFQSLSAAAFEAILIHDNQLILDANDNALELYGYSREQLIKMPLSQLLQPDSSESVDHSFGLAAEDSRLEATHRRANGSIFSVEVHSKEIILEDSITQVTAIRDITERKAMEDELKKLARTDVLTGVNNRRYFLELGNIELSRAQRYRHPVALMMLDIDHFKAINDSFGHDAGDDALKEFSCACLSNLRSTDIYGRLGGEEFAIILPETSMKTSAEVAERIRATVQCLKVRSQNEIIDMTVSIGLSHLQDGDKTLDGVLKRADEAMYEAKNSGRNRIVQH